jgi:hypothetical protein
MSCRVCAEEGKRGKGKQKNNWQKNKTPGVPGRDFSARHFSAFLGSG